MQSMLRFLESYFIFTIYSLTAKLCFSFSVFCQLVNMIFIFLLVRDIGYTINYIFKQSCFLKGAQLFHDNHAGFEHNDRNVDVFTLLSAVISKIPSKSHKNVLKVKIGNNCHNAGGLAFWQP